MSTLLRLIFSVSCFLALAGLPADGRAQYLEAVISVDGSTGSAKVRGKWPIGGIPRNVSFLASSPGAPDLGSRISNLILTDSAGGSVSYRRFNPSEYVSDGPSVGFAYDVDLRPLKDRRSAAHASWIGRDAGVLYLNDLLPRPLGNAPKQVLLRLEIAGGWGLASTETQRDDGAYLVDDVARAVFFTGRRIRDHAITRSNGVSVGLSGEWLFSDAESLEMVGEVVDRYRSLFNRRAGQRALVVIVPFPQPGVPKGAWEAETRGSTVVIVSSDMPFKTQALQRLHEQLRHELFHLWLPNGVRLSGRYDWFYEGFALYQSLRTGVALNRIRFEDLLDTLSRAHEIDRSQTRRRSLIEASQDRWNGADTQLYARGMVVAFLCDLVLLHASNGKTSIETLLERFYSSAQDPARASADANAIVLETFKAYPQLAAIVDDHILGAKLIDLAGIIELAGLENEPGNRRTNLRVKSKLTGKQKTLLNKLGYNNWRRLTRK